MVKKGSCLQESKFESLVLMSWSYVSRNPPNIGSQQDNSICFQWRFAWQFSNPEIVIVACFISGDFIHILGSNHSTLLWDFVILFHQDSNNLGHQGLHGKRSWALKICLLFDSRCFDSRFDLLTFWLKNLKMFSGLCRFTSVLCHCARMAKGAPVESGGTTWSLCLGHCTSRSLPVMIFMRNWRTSECECSLFWGVVQQKYLHIFKHVIQARFIWKHQWSLWRRAVLFDNQSVCWTSESDYESCCRPGCIAFSTVLLNNFEPCHSCHVKAHWVMWLWN